MIGRGLIGSAACLMGLSMPASNAEAGCFTNLFRRSHQQPAVCATQPAAQYVMAYYYNAQGQLVYGPVSSVAPSAQAPVAQAPLDSTSARLQELESEIATLRSQVGNVDSNATDGIDKLDKRTTKLEGLVPGAGGSSAPQP